MGYSHFGFFLKIIPQNDPTRVFFKAAVFTLENEKYLNRPDNRRILTLEAKRESFFPEMAKYGKLLRFFNNSNSLENNDMVHIPPIFDGELSGRFNCFHENRVTEKIVYSTNKLVVEKRSLSFGSTVIHMNDILGEMRDIHELFTLEDWPTTKEKKPIMQYDHVHFEVVLNGNSFYYNILSTQMNAEETKLNHITCVQKDEWRHIGNNQRFLWEKIGLFKLVEFDDSNIISGSRPIFQLQDLGNALALKNQREGAKIKVIKLVNKEGIWIDDLKYKHWIGSISKVDDSSKCTIEIEAESHFDMSQTYVMGDMYRFESQLALGTSDRIRYDRRAKQRKPQRVQEKLTMERVLQRKMTNYDDWMTKVSIHYIEGPPVSGKSTAISEIIADKMMQNQKILVIVPTDEKLWKLEKMTARQFRKKIHESDSDVSKPHSEIKGEENPWNLMLEMKQYFHFLSQTTEARDHAEKMKELREKRKCPDEKNEFDTTRKQIISSIEDVYIQLIMNKCLVVFAKNLSEFENSAVINVFQPSICIFDDANQVHKQELWPQSIQVKEIILAGNHHDFSPPIFELGAWHTNKESSILDIVRTLKAKLDNPLLPKIRLDLSRIRKTRPTEEPVTSSEVKTKSYHTNHTILEYYKSCTGERFENAARRKYLRIPNGTYYPGFYLADTMRLKLRNNIRLSFEKLCGDIQPFANSPYGSSYLNPAEIRWAFSTEYRRLLKIGVQPKSIAVITDHSAQMLATCKFLSENEELFNYPNYMDVFVGTVDDLRGKEFEVIIYMMVRNYETDIYHINRLLTVCVRAKRQFTFIGNSHMLLTSRETWKEEIHNIYYLHECLRSRVALENMNNKIWRERIMRRDKDKHTFGPECKDFYSTRKEEFVRVESNYKNYS